MSYTLKLGKEVTLKEVYKIEAGFSCCDKSSREIFYVYSEDEVMKYVELYEYYKNKFEHRTIEPNEAIKMLEEIGLIDVINDEDEKYEWMLDVMNEMWADLDYYFPALENYNISYFDELGKEFKIEIEKENSNEK